ncbi:hypothetical protein F0U44_18440 [Nocardioides humilatus]|uniref:Uncharacterized protein n=1 Tax=Nocardioides humilatus TaxID=2607660 RepID=A0A5B1L984_9ACTN|nr:hypothetical protein [Nocardioides humilatus]KAA1416309.1 hypothetical protein F0U44_18440 [Nocardioides humilatus]
MGYDGAGGLREPIDRTVQRLLRRAVLDHATNEHRKLYPPVLHVGVPGVRSRQFEIEAPLDHTLRTDAVEAMLRPAVGKGVVPLLWLTRRGDTEPHDVDAEWSAAVQAAGGELGLTLGLVIVTRHSWHDPRTGVSRTWKRIRER